jgi:hypothetical protein
MERTTLAPTNLGHWFCGHGHWRLTRAELLDVCEMGQYCQDVEPKSSSEKAWTNNREQLWLDAELKSPETQTSKAADKTPPELDIF